jgi:serine protease Do
MRTLCVKSARVLLISSLILPVLPAHAANFTGNTAPAATLHERPDSFADVVEGLLPAVVNISSTQKMEPPEDYPELPQPQLPPGSPFEDFFEEFMQKRGMEGPAVPAAALGSGFVIDGEKGYVITNAHVVKDAEDVRVTFQDNETVKAEVVGRDEKTDLAVLKVQSKKKMSSVKFGDSDKLRVGDWIVAIGNPFGLGGTVTAGIVSARQRDINAGPYDDFIQTDASINRGNSGGPMFNVNGEVIGINTAIFSPSGGSVGIGFAIPSSLAKPVIDQIIQYGHTRRGWLGVRIQSVTPDIAESLGLPVAEGALVASLTPKSPAEEAGLKPGDIITEFNGQKLNAMRQLPRIVAETPIGTEAALKYWRGGKEATAKVKIGELEKAEESGLLATGPRSEASGVKVPSIGVTLDGMNETLRKDYGVPPEVEGVFITGVDNMSEAAVKGLLEGDVIVEINQQPVSSPQNVADTVEKAKKAGKPSVLLLLNRAGDVRFVALKLDEKEVKTHTEPRKYEGPEE